MTNPGGDSSETPTSDSGSGPSEPSSDSGSGASEPSPAGYEAAPIEQSQQQPAEPSGYPPPGYTPPPPAYEVPPGYQPPPGYEQPSYPPPGYAPPPSYPPPVGGGQPGYPPPYPDPSAYGSQPYPPPPPQYGGMPGYPPPSSYPATGYSGSYAGGYGQQAETNQLAIWSLVSSLVGFCCWIGSIVGIVLGVIALNQIKEKGQGGHGLAVAGIAVGVASLIISIIWYSFAFST